MEKLLKCVKYFNSKNKSKIAHTFRDILTLCIEYPSGLTPAIIASELDKRSNQSPVEYVIYKVSKIIQDLHPTIILELEDYGISNNDQGKKQGMILHSKYFDFIDVLKYSTIRLLASSKTTNCCIDSDINSLYIPAEIFITPTEDVSWLFPSLLEDVQPNNMHHNLILIVISVKVSNQRVDVGVSDSEGAEAIICLHGPQITYAKMFFEGDQLGLVDPIIAWKYNGVHAIELGAKTVVFIFPSERKKDSAALPEVNLSLIS